MHSTGKTPYFTDEDAVVIVRYELVVLGIVGGFLYARGWRLADFNVRITWRGAAIGV